MTKRHYRVSEWTVCVCATVCVLWRKMQVTFYCLPSSSYCSRYKLYLDLFKQSRLSCCSVGCFSSPVYLKVFHMLMLITLSPAISFIGSLYQHYSVLMLFIYHFDKFSSVRSWVMEAALSCGLSSVCAASCSSYCATTARQIWFKSGLDSIWAFIQYFLEYWVK